jgi:hypothetical protein
VTTDELLTEFARLPNQTVSALARGLRLGDGPLSTLGNALEHLAAGSDELAALCLRRAVRVMARDEALVERLGQTVEQPWPAVRACVQAFTAAQEQITRDSGVG